MATAPTLAFTSRDRGFHHLDVGAPQSSQDGRQDGPAFLRIHLDVCERCQ